MFYFLIQTQLKKVISLFYRYLTIASTLLPKLLDENED